MESLDYLFSITGHIGGWASWKRVIDTWDEHYEFLDDKDALRLLSKLPPRIYDPKEFIRVATQHRCVGKAFYESILVSNQLLNSRLNIVPTKNMISNIGFSSDATHTVSFEALPRGLKRVFYMKTHDIEFPIKHPKYVVCDMDHVYGTFRIVGKGHYFVLLYRHWECRFMRVKKNIKKLLRLS